MFFTLVTVVTGGFVWQWAELGSARGQDRTLAFLFGYGSITLELPDADVEVTFNDQPMDVPSDGVVSLPIDNPGSYVVTVSNDDGSVHGGEFLVKAGARVASGMLASATRVVVTGPIRGSIPSQESADVTTKHAQDDLPHFQGTWRRVSAVVNGTEMPLLDRDKWMVIDGDAFFDPARPQKDHGKIVLDATKAPPQIDVHIPDGDDGHLVLRGIYKIEKDRITVFQQDDWTATTRPTDFQPALDDKRSLVVYQRVPDDELLQGTWNVIGMELAGQVAPASAFADKRYLFQGELVSRTGEADELREFRLDPSTTPTSIDMPGSVAGQFAKGIYEVRGDALRLCFPQQTDLERPRSFATEGTKYVSMTLKRVRATSDAATESNSIPTATSDEAP